MRSALPGLLPCEVETNTQSIRNTYTCQPSRFERLLFCHFNFFDTHQMVSHPEPGLLLLQLCCMGSRKIWLVSMYEGSQN